MILHILRALFVLLMAAIGWHYVDHKYQPLGDYSWLALAILLVIAVLFVCIDILSPRKKLVIFSGTFLGLLVGIFTAFGLSYVVQLVLDQIASAVPAFAQYMSRTPPGASATYGEMIRQFLNLVLGIICCYLAISFILQTKDDFRFVIPYVEFSKQIRGARPILVDTSILIDGRIVDIAQTGVLESRLIVPRFVLAELQALADSGDRLKRNRGRRGLDVLGKLQGQQRVEVILYDSSMRDSPENAGVDEKLMLLARELSARLLTTDYNLCKVAHLRGVDVVNLNDLASALRPVVLPGERMTVRLVKPGEEPSQGVGYLEDGTMVVVEQGRSHLNQQVEFAVTSVLQTSAGRMIFGRMGEGPAPGPRQRNARGDSAAESSAAGT